MPNIGNGSSNRCRAIGSLRRGQIIQRFAPGAIVEMPNYTVIMGSCDTWFPRNNGERMDACTLHDRNLERLLRVEKFCEPPAGERPYVSSGKDIEAMRFPSYHFCPECGRLAPFWTFDDDQYCRNGHSRIRVLPSRFIAMCKDGHIQDFPFRWWVHNGPTDCHGALRLTVNDKMDGLSGITVSCTECGAHRNMEGALGSKALKGCKCRGKKPWIRHYKGESCDQPLTGALRNASNVHYPVTVSALTIPPWSTTIQQLIARHWKVYEMSRKRYAARYDEVLAEEDAIKDLYDECRKDSTLGETLTLEDIKNAVNERKQSESNDEDYSSIQLRHDEYGVLTRPGGYHVQDDTQFRSEVSEISPRLSDYISDAVLITRLREVLALKSFRRINEDGTENLPGDERANWLPAIEMLGEGIFIRLNEERVKEWSKRVSERYHDMKARFYGGGEWVAPMMESFTPRFVLLHTLAHLLIRQLATESGYAAAAIKERIYCSNDPSHPMAGILVYTSSSDADGSLGGLVRRGKRDALEKTMLALLEEASWCASDPVCAENRAQGYEGLNYAACHACTLMPETSCEVHNCLLDRAAVVGVQENRRIGYFGELVEDLLKE